MGGFLLDDVDDFLNERPAIEVSLSFVRKCYDSIFECKESVVSSHSYILSWKNISSTLANQNRTKDCSSTWRDFNTQIFWI